MTWSTLRLLPGAALLALALAACGGGDGDGGGDGSTTTTTFAPGSQVPNSALQSVSGLVAFLNELISGSTNDTGEPVLLGNVVLPTSDTTEPSN